MNTSQSKHMMRMRNGIRKMSIEEQELLDFFNAVWSERGTAFLPSELQTRMDLYEGMTLEDKIEGTPELYLAIEDQIMAGKAAAGLKKLKLRQNIQKQHAYLEKYITIWLLFKAPEEQEFLLCCCFLKGIINKAKTIEYPHDLEMLPSMNSTIDHMTLQINSNSIDRQRQLLSYSNQLYKHLKVALGAYTTDTIFVTTYKRHLQSYGLLDTFATVFHILPESIVMNNLINFPSKHQMFNMLRKQLLSMEEINTKLTQEIVERKRIEEELKQSEYLQSKILETAMDGIILVDDVGTILSWNKQAEHILEQSKETTLGRSIFSIVPHKFRVKLRTSFKNYLATGEDELINRRMETTIHQKGGATLFIELTIVAIDTKDGCMFNAFFRDITHRKAIDREIIEAKVVAEKSAKAKSLFLSNMSHEIRTPLNVILGLTSILQKEYHTFKETAQKNIDVIQFSAQNLLVLINDVLDFSKIEAGKYTLEKNDFNIHELLDNISSGFSIKAQEKGLAYTMSIDPKVPKFIIGDRFRLNQILTNLLGNAIKFTSKGKVCLTVTAIAEKNTECTIQFSVSDTGIGIPEGKLRHIFNSFYQVHKPGKHKIEGTGLGLSISKQLIELHQSTLHAKSTLQKGSIFEFTITYPKSELKSVTNTPTHAILTDKKNHLSGIKVLVVEDNKMNQFFIQQLFSGWDIDSDIADNGVIALEKLQHTAYDLILMDMHMPIMDGIETTKQIRASEHPQLKNIPIIGCSADVFPEAKKNAMNSGMNFYITKPVSENALQEILCTLTPKTMEHNAMRTTSIKASQTYQKSTAPTAKTPLLNFDHLRTTFDNDTDIIRSILEIFLEETPKDYTALQDAFQQNDISNIGAIAHKLKSSFQTIGLQEQASVLAQIERLAKNEEPSELQRLQKHKQTLDTVYDTIIAEIKHNFFSSIS